MYGSSSSSLLFLSPLPRAAWPKIGQAAEVAPHLQTGASGLEPALGRWPTHRVRAGWRGRWKWCSETGCCSSGWKSRRRDSQFAAVVVSGRCPGDPATRKPGSKHLGVKRGKPLGGRMAIPRGGGSVLGWCCTCGRKGTWTDEEWEIPEDSARRWVRAAEPDAGRCLHGLSRTERKETGEAGA